MITPPLPAPGKSIPETAVDHHQRRGAAWDIIDEAIMSFDDWMLDDNFNAQDVLYKIMRRMRERRDAYRAICPDCFGFGGRSRLEPECCGLISDLGYCRADCAIPREVQEVCSTCGGSGRVLPSDRR